MAQLPRGRTRALTAAAVLSAALGLAPAAVAEVDLTGSWHVLVHYKDDATTHPERERWLDRLWVFEEKNGKLYWTEYPIVVFSDETGRFERRASGQYARVLGKWEPTASQESNIRAGLKINSRGSKKKKLKGSNTEGWKTTYRARPGSASVVTYQENWSIAEKGGLPVFVHEDVMASVRTETLEGTTRYTTRGVEGDVLVGSYERDGTRHGSFRMTRSGGAIPLEKRDQREIQRAAFERSVDFDRVAEPPAPPPEHRDGVPAPPAEAPPEEPPEIGDDWMKAGVEHDDRVHYGMFFASDTERELHIGYEGSVAMGRMGMGTARAVRRNKETRYALYFRAPKGTRVVAARAGWVADVGGVIAVLHDDGTFARYWPIDEAKVKKGEPVERGALLGLSGAQRDGDTYQVAFGVFTVGKGRSLESLRVRFDDGSAEGFEPVQGAYYPGAEAKRAEASE